jgi:hypothetical protein
MLEIIKLFLKQREWTFSQVEGKDILIFGMSGPTGKTQCFVNVIESEHKFMFYSLCGISCPEDKRKEASELITRLNYGKFLGNFEMDFGDGEIRYKTSTYYIDVTPTIALVEYFIMINIASMGVALPGITGVAFGEMSALDAFDLIRKEIEAREIKTVVE